MSDITRTFFTTTITAKVFDNDNDEITPYTATIPGKIPVNECKKALEKEPGFTRVFTILKVIEVSYDEKLYSMPESTFVVLGKVADERSKETRNTVSKTILGYIAHIKVADNESLEIRDDVEVLPRKMSADEAKKYLNKKFEFSTVIKVTGIQETNSLYYMSVEDFMKNAEVLPPRVKSEAK